MSHINIQYITVIANSPQNIHFKGVESSAINVILKIFSIYARLMYSAMHAWCYFLFREFVSFSHKFHIQDIFLSRGEISDISFQTNAIIFFINLVYIYIIKNLVMIDISVNCTWSFFLNKIIYSKLNLTKIPEPVSVYMIYSVA